MLPVHNPSTGCLIHAAHFRLAGLLTSGIVPAMHHCLHSIMADDAVLLPASATVYVQAAEIRTNRVCGFDMSAVNRYRWTPAFAAGVPCTVPEQLSSCTARKAACTVNRFFLRWHVLAQACLRAGQFCTWTTLFIGTHLV
jgi:hypothetical protein